jgi:lipopolysaccharide export system permease protein
MLVVLVKRNELVAFMALGLSKVRIILPIIFINIIILSIFILMKFTPLAYSKSWQDSILDRDNYMLNSKEAIFVKYNEYYIYMNKLYPELKKAKDIVIYRVDNKSINQIIEAKEGFYKGEAWLIKNPKITTKSDDKVYIENKSSIKTLIGFKPKILDNIYESKEQLSIIDGFKALFLLKEQGVRTEKILINLYSHLTLPLFLIPILVIIYIQTPISSRFFSVGKFVALYIFVALVIWGVNFMLHRLGSSGTLNVEIATFVPIVTLFGIMLYLIYKKGIK